jgi:hypothetical protein
VDKRIKFKRMDKANNLFKVWIDTNSEEGAVGIHLLQFDTHTESVAMLQRILYMKSSLPAASPGSPHPAPNSATILPCSSDFSRAVQRARITEAGHRPSPDDYTAQRDENELNITMRKNLFARLRRL